MSLGRAFLLVVALSGCGALDAAPPELGGSHSPQVLFLVKNEVLSIRLDGTDRVSLGKVGGNRFRTGFPRFLPDGRMAVLGDEQGGIYPYIGDGKGVWMRLPMTNVTYHDALCGVSVAGKPRLVFTNTPWTPLLPMRAELYLVDPDHPELDKVAAEDQGGLSFPSPWDDSHVLVVRSWRLSGQSTGVSSVEVLRVDGVQEDPRVLVELPPGLIARSPARLPDGRVVFIVQDPRHVSDTAKGEIYLIDPDGSVRMTGITGVLGMVVVGDRVIYEVGGMERVSDIVMTDLAGPPKNITNTPYVSEHLDWSN
jgi:hypothetical protein